MDLRLTLLIALAACSGKTKGADDARHHVVEPPPLRDGAVPTPADGNGDVQIRVEWKDVPIAARASPGPTACKTARAGSVAPTTTWGIPDVVVTIDVAGTTDAHATDAGRGKDAVPATDPARASDSSHANVASRSNDAPRPATRPAPRIELDTCALVPRVALAGRKLTVASDADAPAKLTLHRVSELPLGTAPGADDAKPIYLPIAGHAVDVALDTHTIYRVDSDEDAAWIVATDSAFTAITEANGQVVLRDVPAGPHALTAWLPARSGQPQHVAHGTVTVIPGGLAEVTLDISK